MKRETIRSKLHKKNFTNTTLTFSVEKMKSKRLLMVRPFIETYTLSETLLDTYYGEWWAVGTEYQSHFSTFELDDLSTTSYYRIGLIVDNVTTTNKLYFNHIQLSEGDVTEYHPPESSIPKTTVRLDNNFYANFYTSNEDSYLQVIRPYFNNLDTKTITKSKVTVLAPHLANEDDRDSPSSVGLEFMNQTDQKIEILR